MNVRSVLLMICLAAGGVGAAALAEYPIHVETVLKAKFDRVAGSDTGGAALYPDTTSDWFNHTFDFSAFSVTLR